MAIMTALIRQNLHLQWKYSHTKSFLHSVREMGHCYRMNLRTVNIHFAELNCQHPWVLCLLLLEKMNVMRWTHKANLHRIFFFYFLFFCCCGQPSTEHNIGLCWFSMPLLVCLIESYVTNQTLNWRGANTAVTFNTGADTKRERMAITN